MDTAAIIFAIFSACMFLLVVVAPITGILMLIAWIARMVRRTFNKIVHG